MIARLIELMRQVRLEYRYARHTIIKAAISPMKTQSPRTLRYVYAVDRHHIRCIFISRSSSIEGDVRANYTVFADYARAGSSLDA